jgi:hypothetical protein
VAEAVALREARRSREALGLLRAARTRRDERDAADYELVPARHAVACDLVRDAVPHASPPRPRPSREGPRVSGFPPRITCDRLDADAIVDALSSVGCLWVSGLLDQRVIPGLVEGIDRAFAGYDAADAARAAGCAATPTPWFSAFVPDDSDVHCTRPWLRGGGGLFAADSPRIVGEWFDLVERTGLLRVITECFDEPPITSLDKCALRRIEAGDGIEWHQDGAFLGPESQALNVWVSLTDCSDAPGLEIVDRRFDDVVETGTGGANYPWSVGPDVVARLGRDAPVVRPHFRAGDALIFDGLLLHRTAPGAPASPAVRYAIETWFFRPSRFPQHQRVPLAF